MHRLVLSVALPAALLLALIIPATASAFPLSNCTLNLFSTDKSGASVDSAAGGAPDATQQDPFVVDWDGTVRYDGTTGAQVIKNNTWFVNVFHFPTPLRGGSPNDDGNQKGNGSVGVSANAPFRITGLYFVDGAISGQGGQCAGSGWFKLAGDPVGTVPFFVGLGLLIIGALLVVGAIAGSALAGFIGGIVLGLGAAVMLVIYSVALFGEFTPLTALAAGLIAGVALVFVARARARGKLAAAPI
jgi:hypothetical protein